MKDLVALTTAPLTILCIGAHADDLEIGCAATIMQLIRARRVAHIHWVVLSAEGTRMAEAEAGAAAVLEGLANREVEIAAFRDGHFPAHLGELKGHFESLKRKVDPDLVFTHQTGDMHQDHRIVAELTWQTFRNHAVLQYEVPKYDGDLQTPNVYVPLSSGDLAAKCDVLSSCYPSQAGRHWFHAETFQGLARIRGLECRSPTAFAEAFIARKLFWNLSG